MTRHPIGVVAERTGLSQELLRVWERRYGVVVPERGEGGQRLYSDDDIERLRLLRRATQGGRSIGGVAGLSSAELLRLVREDDEASIARHGRKPAAPLDEEVLRAVTYAREMDAAALDVLLRRTASTVGVPSFVEGMVAPFMRRVGDEWHAGRLTPAHEHLATSVVQRVLATLLASLPAEPGAPSLVVASLTGDRHEVGVMVAAAAAASEGWRVVYLGADLPAGDIMGAAEKTGAAAVAISIVYVDSVDRMAGELRSLRLLLRASVPVLVGGAGAAAVVAAAGAEGVLSVTVDGLRAALRRVEAASAA